MTRRGRDTGSASAAGSGPNNYRLPNLSDRQPIVLGVERRCRALDRLVIRLVAQPERSMVHRHEQPRRGRVCHRDRLLGRAVVANPGVVRADWHDGGLVWSMAPMA